MAECNIGRELTPAPVITVVFPAPRNVAIRFVASEGVMILVVVAFDNMASGMVGTLMRIAGRARVTVSLSFLYLNVEVEAIDQF